MQKQSQIDKNFSYSNNIILELKKKFQPKPHLVIAKPMTYAVTDVKMSEYAIDSINKVRLDNGKNPISHDSRAYDLALARAKDMYKYDYLDHKNPHTGTCSNNLKSEFGFDQKEGLVENAAIYNVQQDLAGPPVTDIIDAWMKSTGHKYNLLYYDHKSGGFACYGRYCVFLGVSDGGYTGSTSTECHTAK
ncbi:MAG: CAP domain-containing protein, partial [Nitrosopumilaceae archaeon]|nr:CAP domain-containing protein [Nitrosopumilaceae archaeon]